MSDTPEKIAAEARKRWAGLTLRPRVGFAVLAGLVVVALAVTVLTSRIDLWGMDHRKAEREAVKAEAATDDASARRQEATGERQSQARVSVVVSDERRTSAALAQAIEQARSAPDANEALPADRAAQHHAADRQLCLGSHLRGCEAAAPPDAGARR